MNFIFLMALVAPLLGWDIAYSSLNDWSFSNDGWTLNVGSTYISDYTCPVNQMKLLCLNGNTRSGYKTISGLPPHYQLRVVADLYYGGYYTNEYGKLMLDSTLILHNSYHYSSMKVNINQCGSWPGFSNLEIQTAVGVINHSASAVYIYLISTVNVVNEVFCIRNMQLLINPCHYSCLTCNGNLQNNCLSCYNGETVTSGRCPICGNPNLSYWSPLSGCVQECIRANYLADQNKFCQINNRVAVVSTSFVWASFQVPSSYDWDLYNNGGQQTQRYMFCNGQTLAGFYYKEEYITKSYSFSSTTSQIRVRISHYMFNFNQYSQIELLMDGVFVSMIYMKEGIFRAINNNVIGSSNSQLSDLAIDKKVYYFRTEQIIKITNLNPTFTFKSSQDLWSVGDIYVDSIVCSLYCSTCMDDNNCSVCQANYFLYKGQCISTCPEYSTISGVNCIDFDEETQCKLVYTYVDTCYLIKAFYSFDSQDTETSLFNLLSSSGTNFQKGNSIYFSYLKDRRIFGGALVWLNAKFGNTYTIPQAHYAVRVRMLVILGDDFGNGQFQYQLNTNSIVTLDRLSPSTSHSQQWGDVQDEYFYQVNTLVSHTTSSFSITVECIGDASKAINQAFCGIANYFVTVLECPTFCDACTDNLSCSSWSTTTPNFDPITHQCFPGYSTDIFSKACLADPVCGNGVLELYEECDDGNLISGDGCYKCQYECSNLISNCVICDLGYLLNQYDHICYPICGDGIIVAEEQCEDGNILPFDGCDRCMFSCQDACSDCRNGQCYKCKTGWSLQNGKCQPICGDGIVRGFEICDDTNSYQIVHNCQSNICSYICPNNCHNCTYGVCQQCEGGFKLNQLVNKCENVCGDLNITDFEECDDGNLVPYDGCHLCMFQCQNSCSDCRSGKCYRCKSGWEWKSQTFRCEPICGDGLRVEIEVCDNRIYQLGDVCLACQFECPNNCIACDYGFCKVCDTGYQLDKIRNDCQPICGDNLVTLNEDCDDGNLIPDDGCHECQLSCQNGCEHCWKGYCLQCKQGWILNDVNFTCFTICGDGEVAGLEFCDDGNDVPLDGCYECNFYCQQEYLVYEQEKFQLTQDLVVASQNCSYFESCDTNIGIYIDLQTNQCISYCGDKIMALDEKCDDGNLIPYDGCFGCQFTCEQTCTDCFNGICSQCDLGFVLISNNCPPICGDSLLRGDEECDDGNLIPYDGCYECSYHACDTIGWELQINSGISECYPICGDTLVIGNEECDDPENLGCQDCRYVCHEKCLDCIQGICFKCAPGWYNTDSQCYSFCGDGYKIETEECDDFNLVDLDGCSSNCEIEAQWICEIYNHLSVCSHIVAPSFKLEHEFTQSATQYIKIGFTNAMRKYCDFTFNIEIEGCEDNSYAIQNTSIVPAQFNKLQNLAENIEITFNKGCIRPNVKISLNDTQCLQNFYEQKVNPSSEQIIFKQINILSQDSRQKAIIMGTINTYVFYIFLGLLILSILTRGTDLMWNLLDFLQYYSYLKFINVPFPQNLEIYFESFEAVSMQPLLDFIQIDDLINFLTGGAGLPKIECINKFSELNGLFIDNAQSFTIVLLFSIIMYILQIVIFKVLKKFSLLSIMKMKLKNANIFVKVNRLLYFSINSFFTSELLRILMGSAYDINFSIFLQLANISFQTQFQTYNSIFSLINLLVYLLIVYSLFQYKGNKFPPLFEGIKLNSRWGKEFNCLQLFKKTIFMFFLVCLSSEPIIQCLLISLLCQINILYIYIAKPFRNIYEYYKVLLSESVYCLCCLSFIFYEINSSISQLYSDEIYQLVGWAHIAMISLLLVINLAIDIMQYIQLIINAYKREKQKELKKYIQGFELGLFF